MENQEAAQIPAAEIDTKKRPADVADLNDAGKKTRESAPVEKSEKLIRKQIEYYFSDDNLKRDRFFHPKISADAEGWLDMKNVLSCKKIQDMSASQSDIIAALAESHLETKVDSNDVAWIRRTTPLPPLDLTPRKSANTPKNDRPSRAAPRTVRDIHSFGYLLRVTNIPEEVAWNKVKTSMQAAIAAALNTAADDKHSRIRHVFPVSNGETFIFCRKFDEDASILAALTSLDLNGASAEISIVEDVPLAARVFERLPPTIKKDREREHMKLRTDMLTKPLMVGGSRFESIEHLKKCYRELLDTAVLDMELKPTAFKVIRALLDFHPNASVKALNVRAIKVAERKDLPDDSKQMKCFFLIREDGTEEDFSMIKCMDVLSKNPPYILDDAATPAPTTPATTATPSTEGEKQSESTDKAETPAQASA